MIPSNRPSHNDEIVGLASKAATLIVACTVGILMVGELVNLQNRSASTGIVLDRDQSFPITSAVPCEATSPLLSNLSRSQSKEDMFLANGNFKGLCGGVYVELGGLDGVTFSNSYLFHHSLGWHGVLIEPNPESFKELQANRPEDETFNFAVCSKSQEVTFIESGRGAVSGVLEFMPPAFVQKWHRGRGENHLTKIKCEPLSHILEQSTVNTAKTVVDFLSVDVEGAEFEVIKTIDFTRVQFGIIFYEADGLNPLKDESMKTFLEDRGYVFREHRSRSNFHVNKRWHDIYGAFSLTK